MAVPVIAWQIVAACVNQALTDGAKDSELRRELAMRQIEVALQRDRLSAQVHVVTLVMDAARHVFDCKAEMLKASFDAELASIDASIQKLHDKEQAASLKMPDTKKERIAANRVAFEARKERLDLMQQRRAACSQMYSLMANLDMKLAIEFKPPELQ